MTWDEMKNRISMALKDPILQQGFEIICKENAELKQAKEGKVVEHFEAYGQCRDSRRIAELEALIHAERKRQEQCDDIHLRKIAELEKENAELKRDYDQRGNIITSLENQLRMYIHSDKTDQLTKAVKHLKDLVYVVELGKNELATARILAEAKEFLKETK
jgi:hypothetical protein